MKYIILISKRVRQLFYSSTRRSCQPAFLSPRNVVIPLAQKSLPRLIHMQMVWSVFTARARENVISVVANEQRLQDVISQRTPCNDEKGITSEYCSIWISIIGRSKGRTKESRAYAGKATRPRGGFDSPKTPWQAALSRGQWQYINPPSDLKI